METLDYFGIPLIVSVTYVIIILLKQLTNNNEKLLRLVPIIAAAVGTILGIAAYFLMPEQIPYSNMGLAALVGGASGLAATGTNQILKQLKTKALGKTDEPSETTLSVNDKPKSKPQAQVQINEAGKPDNADTHDEE